VVEQSHSVRAMDIRRWENFNSRLLLIARTILPMAPAVAILVIRCLTEA